MRPAPHVCSNNNNGVTMALIQTDRDNVVRLAGSLRSPAPIRPLARQIVHLSEHALAFVRRRLAYLAQWSTQRRARNGLTMAERSRQRRELAQLTDRELRDIGISRYDIEFVLRRPSWR
jgi:uncharacterized protein YjiS (DUF1127 family)